MSENDLGPSGGGVNATTAMPAYVDSGGNTYTWFKDCSGPESDDGTRFTAQWANRIMYYIRQACDGMAIARNEADGDRLLKAIQKADKGLEDVGVAGSHAIQNGINVGSNNYKFRKLRSGTGIGLAVNGDGEIVITNSSPGSTPGLAALAPMLSLQEQRPGASAAGTIPTNTWSKRVLNTTIVNQIVGASVAAGVMSLPAGDYRVTFGASMNRCFNYRARLYNTTAGVALLSGLSCDSGNPGDASCTLPSLGDGRFTLAAPSDIELQVYQKTGASCKVGDETDISPEYHVDAQICIIKEA